jgi:WD40 repeat protein
MAVYCLALSHSGTILASGSYDTTTVLWNMDSYEKRFVLRGKGGYVNALDFSADDKRLFTGSNDGKDSHPCILIWLCNRIETLWHIPRITIFKSQDSSPHCKRRAMLSSQNAKCSAGMRR